MPKDETVLWGVSSSGYQSEGGFNGNGQPANNWAHAELAHHVARTGNAADFWNQYEGDFALCQKMGLNAFRLGIEWARVQPSTLLDKSSLPPFDQTALEGYADRIAACRNYGLEPLVTLQHFTHPAWLGINAWLEDSTPALFEQYVRETVITVNRRLVEFHSQLPIRWYVTINEPNMLIMNTFINRQFPSEGRGGLHVAVRALNRLLSAHARAYHAVHKVYKKSGWPRPQVSLNTFCSDVYWFDHFLWDLLSAPSQGMQEAHFQDYFMERAARFHSALAAHKLPLRRDFFARLGAVIREIAKLAAASEANSEQFSFLLAELRNLPAEASFDFIAIDYYDPFAGHVFRIPSFADLELPRASPHARLMAGLASKWWDWHVLPEGMHFFCSYYQEIFSGKGILIAENGMAQRKKADNSASSPRRDRISRTEFLEIHLREVMRMRASGIPILGYFHWSLTDNYEWGSFTPRFGLYSIDYTQSAKRLETDAFGDRPAEAYAALLRREVDVLSL